MSKNKRMATCHPTRPHLANGLCATCYNKIWNKNRSTEKKATCHPERPIKAKGLCNNCYHESLRRAKGINPKPKLVPTCHPDRKHYAKGLCEICYTTSRRRTAGTPPRQGRKKSVCHPDREAYIRGLCYSCHRKEYRKNPDVQDKRYYRHIKKEYGVTPNDLKVLLERCGGVCSICYGPFGGGRIKKPAIDHNHTTKTVRGLLCGKCNTGIGQFDEDTIRMENAIKYLRECNQL